MFYMGGAFDDFNEYTAGLFMNLLYTVLLSLMFAFIIILALFIVYYVLKFILFLLIYITQKLNQFAKNGIDYLNQILKGEIPL